MEEKYWKQSMGNLHDAVDFMTIWNGEEAAAVRHKVASCPKNCWMIGSASPVMKKYVRHVLPWIVTSKFKSLAGKRVCGDCFTYADVGQDPRQGAGVA